MDCITKPSEYSPPAVGEQVDWMTLEWEFITNLNYPCVRTWLRMDKEWPSKKIYSRNTDDHVLGWSGKRTAFRRKVIEKELIDLAEIRQSYLPRVYEARLNFIARIVRQVDDFHLLTVAEKRFVYETIKTELREPIRAAKVTPQESSDSVETLLNDYGLIEDREAVDIDANS